MLHQSGAAAVVLEPGRHWYRRRRSSLSIVDLRPELLKVAGQEVLTADGVGVRAAVVVRFAVPDPRRWVLSSDGFDGGSGRLYLATQLAVRDEISQLPVEDLLASRGHISQAVAAAISTVGAEVGVAVEAADLRDHPCGRAQPANEKLASRIPQMVQVGHATVTPVRGLGHRPCDSPKGEQ